MDRWLQDIRCGVRVLRRSPLFCGIAILSLALGIGLNTALFTLIDAALVRDLPVARPDRLVRLETDRGTDGINSKFSHPAYVEIRDRAAVFEGVAAHTAYPIALATGEGAEQVEGAAVSGNFFVVVGVAAAVGRMLGVADDRPGGDAQVVVLGHALWRRRFGGDPGVIGRTVRLNAQPFTVIGVSASSFDGMVRAERTDLFIPLAAYRLITGRDYLSEPRVSWLDVIGRQRAGVTREQLLSDLGAVDRWRQAESGFPSEYRTIARPAARGLTYLVDQVEQPLVYLMGAVALVLVIACANVSSMLLARAAGRTREVAVRLSLGASRGRIVRQLLTESVILAVVAGGVGLLFAVWTLDLLAAYRLPTGGRALLQAEVDARVLAFTLGIALLTGTLFGLAPALAAIRRDPSQALKDGAGAVRGGWRSGVRGALVTAQVALSLALVVGATMLVRTLRNLEAVDPGFDPRNVLLADIDLTSQRYPRERGPALFAELLGRVSSLRDVESATVASTVTPSPGGTRLSVDGLEGYTPAPDETIEFDLNIVSDRYFETLGVPILLGRSFDERDNVGAPRVAVINRSMAERYWPGQNPVGRRILLGVPPGAPAGAPSIAAEIIGVARDGKYRSLRATGEFNVYFPLAQNPALRLTLLVRTRGEPTALTDLVRSELRALDPGVPLHNVRTLSDHVEVALSSDRMAANLGSLFGLLALMLGAIGLYGLLAQLVAERTREIGVRVALGAKAGNVVALVLRGGLTFVGAGVLIGLPLALMTARLLTSLVFAVGTTGAGPVLAAVAILSVAALTACSVPARRATTIDPTTALRQG